MIRRNSAFTASCERLAGLLSNRAVQLSLLAGLIAVVFWEGLWAGVPRADQLIYLHLIQATPSLIDIIADAPAWHREHGLGDFLLFRPLLFLQLGLSYYFFGYNFVLWQAASLAFHMLAIFFLHACFWRTPLRATAWPMLLCGPVAVSFHGAELVLWNHLGGYLLFTLLGIASINALIKYLDDRRVVSGLVSVTCALLASLCYEAGSVLCVLLGGILILRPWWISSAGEGRGSASLDVRIGIGFVIAGFVCPVWGLVDLMGRGLHTASAPRGPMEISNLLLAVKYAFGHLVYWIEVLFLPWKEKIVAGGRAVIDQGYSKSPFRGFRKLDILAVAAIVSGATLFLLTSRLPRSRNLAVVVAAGAAFLLAYSFIIAFGRSVPRGIEYTLFKNIYYAYIPQMGLWAVLSLCCLAWSTAPGFTFPLIDRHGLRMAGRALLAGGLVAVTMSNALATRSLVAGFRYEFVPNLDEVVAVVSEWHASAGQKPGNYYVVGDTCRGNVPIDWFEQTYFQRGKGWRGTPTFADVLFPDRSFALNKERLAGASAIEVQTLECVSSASLTKQALLGRWLADNEQFAIQDGPSGRLTIKPRGASAEAATIEGNRLVVDAWKREGRLSRTGTTLIWNNGESWHRR